MSFIYNSRALARGSNLSTYKYNRLSFIFRQIKHESLKKLIKCRKHTFLKNGPFWFFQANNTIFRTNQCEKSPSGIRHRDSNPRPLKHESSPITTRPGLPPWSLKLFSDLSVADGLGTGRPVDRADGLGQLVLVVEHCQDLVLARRQLVRVQLKVGGRVKIVIRDLMS